MRILDRSVYVGPSLYAHFPVIRLELDLGALEAWPTGRLGRASSTALAAALPGLAEHGCSYREPGGFFRRMREDEGTWLGHVLEHVAIELQNVAGEDVTFGKTRSADRPGVYTVVYEYAQRDEGIAAGELGAAPAVLAAARDSCGPRAACPRAGTGPTARDEFIRFAQRRALGPVDRLAGARRRGARHPLAAAQRPVAGPARPRQVPAAHPGDGHRPHAAHRGRARERQGGDQQDPRRRSACRCRAGAGAERARGGARRAAASASRS